METSLDQSSSTYVTSAVQHSPKSTLSALPPSSRVLLQQPTILRNRLLLDELFPPPKSHGGISVWYSTYTLIQLQVLNSSERWSSTSSRWCWFDDRLNRRQGPSNAHPTEKRNFDRKVPVSIIMTYDAFHPDDDPEED